MWITLHRTYIWDPCFLFPLWNSLYYIYFKKKIGYIILKITLFSIFPFCRPSAYTYHNPPFLPEPLLMTVVPPMPSVSVDFTKYAETRRSGAEGSINYLPLSWPQLEGALGTFSLITRFSLQLKLHTCCSSSAPCGLEPCISLSRSLLTSPSFTPTWVFIALVAQVVPAKVLWSLGQTIRERSVFPLWDPPIKSSGSHFHLRTADSSTHSNIIHFTCVNWIKTLEYVLSSTHWSQQDFPSLGNLN